MNHDMKDEKIRLFGMIQKILDLMMIDRIEMILMI